MKLIILILLLTTNKVLGQNKSNQYERLEVKNQYNIIETLINNEHTKNEKENNIESYSIIYNSKKDSVVYYGLSNSFPILYVLKNEKKTKKLKLYIMENKKKVDSISIVFSDQKKAIEVNKDWYFFNSTYYKSLKNNVLQLKNIADIIDLLDDMLGDYPYQIGYLKDFSSKNKYNSKDNKILKARIITFRTQANDFKDLWDVSYSYNSKNILTSVIKKSNEEVQFKKELIKSDGIEYNYKVFRNIESRFEDNDIIKFNLKKNSYEEYNKHFEFGIIRETFTKLKRIYYKRETIKKEEFILK